MLVRLKTVLRPLALFGALLVLNGCAPDRVATPSISVDAPLGENERLRVIATTSIVHDIVHQLGGDRIELEMLLPLGADPHSFEPAPRDVALVADSHVVFANGAGLEAFLDPLIESAGAAGRVVEVSEGIELLRSGEAAESGDDLGRSEHDAGGDPHTWTDPNNVITWVQNIARTLSNLDPQNSTEYQEEASRYIDQLRELDAWVREQVAVIPQGERRLVTDHLLFAYLVHAYGFVQVGTVVPGYSSLAAPSAKDLAELEDLIGELGVKAVFVGNTVDPSLAQVVAQDTGAKLVFLYTGSLSDASGPAPTYLDYMRYNVKAIVDALR